MHACIALFYSASSGTSPANHTNHTRPTKGNLQLLSGMDQTNLIHLNSFLFLQGLLDSQYLILWLEIEALLASRQGFDEDLVRQFPSFLGYTKHATEASRASVRFMVRTKNIHSVLPFAGYISTSHAFTQSMGFQYCTMSACLSVLT
jgi:hypothetical protein